MKKGYYRRNRGSVDFQIKESYMRQDNYSKGVIGTEKRGQVTKKTWNGEASAGSAGAVKTGRCAAGM